MYSKEEQLRHNKKPRKRKCLSCKVYFSPSKQGVTTCSEGCAISYGIMHGMKQKRREQRRAKQEHKNNDKSHVVKEVQRIFNKFIRLRDKDLPCISCGHNGDRQRHAGHYRPVGRNSKLRFNEDNCNSQCSICNNHLSGNLVLYRDNLILKIGEERVLSLESDNNPHSFTIEELNSIKKKYTEKVKNLS